MTEKTVSEMEADLAALNKQIEAARKAEAKTIVKTIKEKMIAYGISKIEITSADKATKTGAKVAPKYQDPVTGKTWTGRGKTPLFIQEAKANGTLDSMAI